MDNVARLLKEARRLEKEKRVPAASEVRIAVLGSVSTQHFVSLLRYQLHQEGISASLYEGEYQGIQMDVLDAGSPLYAFRPDFVILLPHFTDLHRWPDLLARSEEVDSLAERTAEGYCRIWQTLRERLVQVVVLQSNFVIPAEHFLGNLERQAAYSRTSFLQRINEIFFRRAPEYVRIVDVDLLASYVGKRNWLDYAAYFLHKSGWRLDDLPELVALYVRVLRAYRGKVRKCLVLDLDNTLWGGVVGDAGWEGVELDPNEATGEAYRYFQRYVLELKRRGVILAVCSKNEMEAAKSPFEKNPYMVLHMEDISCFVANWEDKATNIRAIAERLNIGVDSMVFFDDNPAEREIVRQYLPEVQVIDVPEDPAQYVQALDSAMPFEWLELTKEDLARSQSYAADRQREEMAVDFVDYDSYLQALEMKGRAAIVEPLQIPRFAQLLNKSNQFNLRTRRYTEGEMQEKAASADCRLIAASLRDRFSDYGLISCVILEKKGRACILDSWVMSCRVLKRGVEHMMFARILREAQEMGCDTIVGEYLPTKKNGMVRDFYATLGFSLIEETEEHRVFQYSCDKAFQQAFYIAEE